MDVLYYLKSWNIKVIDELESMSPPESMKDKKEWYSYSAWINSRLLGDRSYLQPELLELSSSGEYLTKMMSQRSLAVQLGLTLFAKGLESGANPGYEKLRENLREQLLSYGSLISDRIMPLLRSEMTHEEREDLYQVFKDIEQDYATIGDTSALLA